jgi:predicted DCC family thiol-disulfide oxidoreductase YuxK
LRVLPIVKVWYDSSCPLCAREIALMRRLDRRGAIRFIDIQAGLDCPLDASELLARFHAQEGDGPVISGAAAFAAMWRATPPLRPLGLLAQNRVVLWLLERAYRGFLLIRPTLQRVLRDRTTRPDSLPG